jgi:hypothetical protein
MCAVVVEKQAFIAVVLECRGGTEDGSIASGGKVRSIIVGQCERADGTGCVHEE